MAAAAKSFSPVPALDRMARAVRFHFGPLGLRIACANVGVANLEEVPAPKRAPLLRELEAMLSCVPAVRP